MVCMIRLSQNVAVDLCTPLQFSPTSINVVYSKLLNVPGQTFLVTTIFLR